MYAYKVTAKNQRNDIQYTDSYWLKKEDADARIERMRIADKQDENRDLADDWHYWSVRILVR